MEYFIAFALAMGINIAMFIPAFIFKTDKLTDLSYAISFAVVALVLFLESAREYGHVLLLSMIFLWAIRLGGYLFIRIRKMDRDKRFDGMRESFPRFLRFWLLQGLTVFVVLLAAIPYFSATDVVMTTLTEVGLIIFIFGLSIETIADIEKYRFINNENNKGKWIDEGLWRFSRHPNYFGEILVWFGVFMFAASSISTTDVFIGALSPLFISMLIIFVSGIPLLEKAADKRWGEDPEYQKYKKSTSVLFLLPKRR